MAHLQPELALSPGASPQDDPIILQTGKIQVARLQFPPGEGEFHRKDGHTLCVNLTPRPIHYRQMQAGKTHSGWYHREDFTITPADVPFFARWEGTENCLQIQLADRFLSSVAQETLAGKGDRFALLPTFQSQNGQIAAIADLLLTEICADLIGGALYLDALANALAVQLLRHHATTQIHLPVYEGGLPPRQLSQILDYIDAHLADDIKLADLAALLILSPFHFSRLFKQSVGLSPHQCLIQQRIERAKQLLRQRDRPIVDIALECGFNSHSHLSKRFRQLTGVTPKTYRMDL